MKNSIKLALAVMAVAACNAVQAQSYTSGDVLIGFNAGLNTGTDSLWDVGQISSLGSLSLNVGVFAAMSRFGAVAYDSVNNIVFTTTTGVAGPPPLNNTVGNVGGGVVSVANGVNNGPAIQSGQSRVTTVASDATFMNGWYNQTVNNANTGNLLQSAGYTIDGFVASSGNNPQALRFWEQQANGTVSLVGIFGYNRSTGILTFSPAVPEPETYGLVAGCGLLLLAIRRQFVTA